MRALLILLVGQAMATMDQSILAVAPPGLRTDLHASGGQLQLVVWPATPGGAWTAAGRRCWPRACWRSCCR
jgi:hypothetical protein